MPSAITNNVETEQGIQCARCQTEESDLVVRTEHLCRNCFFKYVSTKVLKRLESNKLRGAFKEAQKTLLLPVSLGLASICLLDILQTQLCTRAEQGRHIGYRLHILIIDQSVVLDQSSPQDSVGLLKQKFPSHVFSVISLIDSYDDLPSLEDNPPGEKKSLQDTISALPSMSSKVDFIDVIRRRLILSFAKKHQYDGVLFGDSTTRLAERTLSETAKGRGIALPWITADGYSSGIYCAYPMRDLLRKELKAYAAMVSPPLIDLISEPSIPIAVSSKDSTIDGLMSQYFESVEDNYPSIVANVVRTSSKLVAPRSSGDDRNCVLCKLPIVEVSWGGEQVGEKLSEVGNGKSSKHDRLLCYGCRRTIPQS